MGKQWLTLFWGPPKVLLDGITDGHEFEWTLWVGDGQGGLACCDSLGCKESDTTERLNWTGVFLLGFILYGTLCASWTWLTISFSMLGKFSIIISSKIFSYPLFFSASSAAAKSLQLYPTLCDPIDTAHQAPPSLGFSRQEHWSGLPFPSPGNLLNLGIKPRAPTLQADSLPTELWINDFKYYQWTIHLISYRFHCSSNIC